MNLGSAVTRAHACVCSRPGGVSAVIPTAMDAGWKHTWSLSYVLLIEVFWHAGWPCCNAATLKIKARRNLVCTCKQRHGCTPVHLIKSRQNSHAHKARSNHILLRKQNQPPIIKGWYDLASPSLPWSLSPINMLPCVKVYTSSLLHHHLECLD